MNDTSNQVIPFEYGTHQIRSLTIEDQPYFLAIDVCKVLDIDRTETALRKLDDDEKLMRKIYASGQMRDMWLINESGLYTIIMRSNKSEARAFRKWVTSEVLPALRRTGSYQVSHRYEHSDELLEMIEKALAICGSQRKLGKRIGISSAHMNAMMQRKFDMISEEMYERIWQGCDSILKHGAGYDPEMVQLLLGIEDNKLRKALFNKLQKDGNI